jgi:hypothetical protein
MRSPSVASKTNPSTIDNQRSSHLPNKVQPQRNSMSTELKPLLEINGTPLYLTEDWDTGIGGGVSV